MDETHEADARYRRRLSRVLLAVAVAALLALAWSSIVASSSDGSAAEGRPFPAFTLPSLEGEPLDETVLGEQVTVVNFWASWCPPCRSEAPVLRDVSENPGVDGVQFLGVLHRDRVDPALEFVERFDITFPTVVDDGSLATAVGVRSIPATFILDAEGRIVARHFGPIRESRLRVLIEDARAVSRSIERGG